MAFDRETYNQMFYKSTAQLAHALLLSMLMDEEGNTLHALYGYNLERAKEYLIKAGHPDGKELPVITLNVVVSTNSKDKTEFLLSVWLRLV